MLRSYSTLGRALRYAKTLQSRFPTVTFHVQLSPLAGYAFRWLIKATTAEGHQAFVGR